jgi:hypothetical protein
VIGRDSEAISPEFSPSAFHEAVVLEVEQNVLEKLAGNPLLRSNVRDHHRLGASKSE